MTPVRNQAIYACTDLEAARHYREQLHRWLDQPAKESHVGEISKPERQALLSHKATTETRPVLHS